MTDHRFTVSASTLAELRASFEELFGDSGAETGAAPAATSGRGRKKAAPAAPDPAPIASADKNLGGAVTSLDPFTGAPLPAATTAATAADPFAATATAADPFPATPPANPNVEKLIGRFVEKQNTPAIGAEPVRAYVCKMLGLSPSVTLDEAYAKLRGGSVPADVIDKLLVQTGGH